MRQFLVLIFLTCLSGAGHGAPEVSDHFDGKRFFHPWPQSEKSFFSLLKWQWTADRKAWPKTVENTVTPKFRPALKDEELEVTFVGHASVYIRHQGLGILTDPQWSLRASPLTFAGPQRVRKPGVEIEKLPRLDVVLVSHNHYDHLDVPTLKKLKEIYDPVFYIPLGDAYLLKDAEITKFVELDWWQDIEINKSTKLTFVPVRHWSARGLFDRNKSLWGGYVIKSKVHNIYYAGDTGYCDAFKITRNKLGPFTFAMIPIGAYEPRWFMAEAHASPEEAVQIHLDLQAKKSMGIHFGTWQLSDEGFDEPVQELGKARSKLGVSAQEMNVFEVGETRLISIP